MGEGELDAEGLTNGPMGLGLGLFDGVTGGTGHFKPPLKQTNTS